jgi:hypothetical protein
MAKNAPKSLITSPSIKMSEMDGCLSTRMNGGGNAVVVALQMLAGHPEVVSFTPKGEKTPIEYKVLGTLELDGTFEIGGRVCRLAVVKSKWGAAKLEIREVNPKAETATSSGLSF